MKKTKTTPLCTEPWESYYILRRGIFPCCYGNGPIAPMSEYLSAWNSRQMRRIRKYLAKGKFSPYCLKSLSCPIVQKHLTREKKAWVSPKLSPLLRLLKVLFILPVRKLRLRS